MPVDSSDLLPSDHYDLTIEDRERFAEEAALGMIVPSDPLLNAVVPPVDPNNLSVTTAVIEDMKFAATGQRHSRGKKKRRTLVGLAAPQIGVALRIILVDTHVGPSRKNYGQVRCFINPEILWRSRETAEDREGCFSAGPVWGLVRRPIAIKVRALNPDGIPFEQVFEGFTARILQHEIDHLEGIRFPDRIRSDRKRHWVHTEELGIYVKRIRYWERQCSIARWQSVKEGKVA